MKERLQAPVGSFFVKQLSQGKLFAMKVSEKAPRLNISNPEIDKLKGYEFIYQYEEIEYEE